MISEGMIGSRIRRLRLERGMTQEALARAAGLTKGYLSKIENSAGAPPVSTLFTIASAMGIGIDTLFVQHGKRPSCTVFRRADRQAAVRPADLAGHAVQPLAQRYAGRRMEPRVVTLPAGAGRVAEPTGAGEELRYVLAGRLRLDLGRQTLLLEEGDCVYFNASSLHGCESVDGGEVEYLAVSVSPEDGGAGAGSER
jgi:transcriptional regulator with XRE-family HTH domain